ncbi:c-type cytochrome biogenesis protein CcmI [Bordetella sp. BOR01]|uniref:c-type cytochrome biogenesis protein CcmI n=1 Tax=Bordetella sp. BOR01 TaxID=2854779 RepID=UPI001C45D38B|nr:c-type cytochrome biogenesis protein CcmI [Bordetella sp. BOR01]MBV7483590.1 c-type cytochrome biogenesis protein CcmI [Bordetella sp. BOR01]
MIEFWLPAALLLAAALAFVLVPLLRARDPAIDADRTALNVTLYHERLDDLRTQHERGTLTPAQLEAARAEAARTLLADTDGSRGDPTRGKPGTAIALAAALLVPLAGTAVYLHWGALGQVVQARNYAGHTDQTIEQMTARLEAALAAAPDSSEAWFFLGRTYLAQGRAADAAQAFERAATLAGRPPELLGHWIQALYFAGNQQWTPQLQALTDEALAGDPKEMTSLTLAGMAAFESGRYAEAVAYWERLAAALPQDDPTRDTVAQGIARARALSAQPG